jgi:hypothetical protein
MVAWEILRSGGTSNKFQDHLVPFNVMKTITTLLAGTFLVLAAVPANAQYYDRRYDDRYQDRRYDDRRYDDHYDRRHDAGPGHRTKVRAQIRLRQLGYYRGPIDGSIGYGTRRAIARFQRHHGLPATGWLDWRTLRALRIH